MDCATEGAIRLQLVAESNSHAGSIPTSYPGANLFKSKNQLI
jgi:hypothetical protein